MEPITAAVLAGLVVTGIVKGFSEGAGKAVGDSVGKGAVEGSGTLLSTIRKRFSQDSKAERALANFTADPQEEGYADIFKKHLERILHEDPKFFQEVLGEVQRGNLQVVQAGEESELRDIGQKAKGSGHQQQVLSDRKSRVEGIRQESES